MQISEHQIPKRVEGYVLEEFEDELVLYHLDKTQALYLNSTAALIWRLLDGQRSTGEIVQLLQDSYPESAQNVSGDVMAVLEQFIDHGAVRF